LLRCLGGPKKPRSCESAATVNGEATGVPEARLVRECAEETRHASTRAARQSGSSVVNARSPSLMGLGSKPTAQGRSVSFEEMLGSGETRVLVVEASGKQKSVSTHQGRASQRVARRGVEGRPSLEQTIETAAADGGGPSLNRMGCFGRSGGARKRSHAPQRRWGKPAFRAKRCAGIAPNCQRGGMMHWLCPAPQGVGFAWLKGRAHERRLAGYLIRRKAP
jgi:hypothetical protein